MAGIIEFKRKDENLAENETSDLSTLEAWQKPEFDRHIEDISEIETFGYNADEQTLIRDYIITRTFRRIEYLKEFFQTPLDKAAAKEKPDSTNESNTAEILELNTSLKNSDSGDVLDISDMEDWQKDLLIRGAQDVREAENFGYTTEERKLIGDYIIRRMFKTLGAK